MTALVKGKGGNLFTLKGANAQAGPLKVCDDCATALVSIWVVFGSPFDHFSTPFRCGTDDLQRFPTVRPVQRRREDRAVRSGRSWIQSDEAPGSISAKTALMTCFL